MFLTKEQILNAVDVEREIVHCPEWGGDVLIQPLSALERDLWEGSGRDRWNDGNPYHNFRSRLVALAVVDEEGERLFSDDDIDELGKKNNVPVNRIYDAVIKQNKIGEEEVEELEKNS